MFYYYIMYKKLNYLFNNINNILTVYLIQKTFIWKY